MFVITPKLPINMNGVALRPGNGYVVYSQLVSQLRAANAPCDCAPAPIPHRHPGGETANLLVLIAGGLGDRVQASPSLEALAARTKSGKADVAGLIAPEWDGLPYIGLRIGWPVPVWLLSRYDLVLTWEGIIDADLTEAHTLPLQQLFQWYAGLPMTAERPDFRLQPGEERLDPLGPREPGEKRVVLHSGCNGPARAWPAERFVAVAEALRGEARVVIVGGPTEGPEWRKNIAGRSYVTAPPDHIVDLCGALPDVRSLAQVLSNASCFVGVDSGPLHIAGALGIPSVGLYGAFPYAIRGANLPSVTPISAQPPGPQCPCYSHATASETLPCGDHACAMMAAIPVAAVMETVRSVLASAEAEARCGAEQLPVATAAPD